MRQLVALAVLVALCAAQNEITEFENPTDCGNQASDWKPCIERKVADQVFGACCERFVPPECRGLCIYETHPIESRVVLMHTIQPSRCRLYKYLSAVVHCAAQTHDNTACCKDMGVEEIGPQCTQLCHPQANPRQLWGVKSLRRDLVQCLAKWDQIMHCHQSGLRARKIIRQPTKAA
ncbi:DB module family protein [Aphelenchoides avenae]|nr:DB module family protein [Aphelenchus avenae]